MARGALYESRRGGVLRSHQRMQEGSCLAVSAGAPSAHAAGRQKSLEEYLGLTLTSRKLKEAEWPTAQHHCLYGQHECLRAPWLLFKLKRF